MIAKLLKMMMIIVIIKTRIIITMIMIVIAERHFVLTAHYHNLWKKVLLDLTVTTGNFFLFYS